MKYRKKKKKEKRNKNQSRKLNILKKVAIEPKMTKK